MAWRLGGMLWASLLMPRSPQLAAQGPSETSFTSPPLGAGIGFWWASGVLAGLESGSGKQAGF